jgi:hypothetical protein
MVESATPVWKQPISQERTVPPERVVGKTRMRTWAVPVPGKCDGPVDPEHHPVKVSSYQCVTENTVGFVAGNIRNFANEWAKYTSD